MRWVIFWTVALTFLFAYTSRADELSFKYGLGIINGKPTPEVKAFAVRYEQDWGALKTAAEGGVWGDTGRHGRLPGMHMEYQAGIAPSSEHFYASAFWGPGFILPVDSQLGGPLQFVHDLGFGFKDNDTSLGIGYKHISSAGLERPNKGRDFLMIKMGVRF